MSYIHTHSSTTPSSIPKKNLEKALFFKNFLMSGKVTNVAATVIIVDLNTQSSGYF